MQCVLFVTRLVSGFYFRSSNPISVQKCVLNFENDIIIWYPQLFLGNTYERYVHGSKIVIIRAMYLDELMNYNLFSNVVTEGV